MAQGHRDPHTEQGTRSTWSTPQPDQDMRVRWFEGGFGLLYDRLLTTRVQHGPFPTHIAIIKYQAKSNLTFWGQALRRQSSPVRSRGHA